jgi:hypothetical protein
LTVGSNGQARRRKSGVLAKWLFKSPLGEWLSDYA